MSKTAAARRKKREKRASSHCWDVVVIGTGMGGSAAGAVCALRGLKTLIMDKNPRPGGSCSYYEKEGFHLDTGTHLFIRCNKGPFGTLTRRLGMGHPIEFVRTPYMTHIRGMNVDAKIPASRAGMAMVLPKLAWQLRINPAHYPSMIRLFYDMLTMPDDRIDELDGVSIESFILRYTENPQVRAMLGMLLGLFFILPPWEASAGESIWNFQRMFFENNLGYPKGGAVTIPKTFLRGARIHGAEVRLGDGARAIEVYNGRVESVVMESGERIFTKAVISTTTLTDTVLRLVGPGRFPEAYVKTVEAVKPAWSGVQAKIALKRPVVHGTGSIVGCAPMRFRIEERVVREAMERLERGIQADIIPVYAPVPTNYDPSLAPPGCQVINAITVAPTLDVGCEKGEQAWIDGLMSALARMIPGLVENIIFVDTWTVSRLAAWTGKSGGAAISTAQTTTQSGSARPGHKTPIAGLYVAGDSCGRARGVGTELACQSGIDCADLVADEICEGVV